MIPASWSDEECAAFYKGFDLAKPPGPDEADALDRAEEFAPAGPGQLHVAVPRALAKAFLAEIEPLPENLAGAAWSGTGSWWRCSCPSTPSRG